MSEREPLSDLEQDFISHLRAKRGACPSDEELVAFQQGSSPHAEREIIESHVRLCGSCELALEMLKRFEEVETKEIREPPEWPEVAERSRKRFEAFLNQRSAPAAVGSTLLERLRRVLMHPALAYSLLFLATGYLIWTTLLREPRVIREVVTVKESAESKEAMPVIASIKSFELNAAERSGEARANVVRLAPQDKAFALSFLVPIHMSAAFSYELEIRDSQGRVVADEKQARPQDELGNFLLTCPRSLFPVGRYELAVNEVNEGAKSSRLVASYRFEIEELVGKR
ncbi:MAG: hypothetical protein HY650_00445 [Acidobacteria bacterium]|nr:hypothetical protein [Acidobacteriota bacterium]